MAATTRTACSAFLGEVLKEHPQYTGLLTIKPDGSLHCDSLRSGRVLKLNDRAYFQQALTARGPVVEAAVGRLTGKGVLQIAYPVRDGDGRLRYILLASLDMDAYGRSVALTLPYAHMHFQIWNRDGSVIMDNPGPGSARMEVGPGQRQFMLAPSEKGSETLGTDSLARIWVKASLPRSQDAGLRLALSVPEADLNEARRRPVQARPAWTRGAGGADFSRGRGTERVCRAAADRSSDAGDFTDGRRGGTTCGSARPIRAANWGR